MESSAADHGSVKKTELLSLRVTRSQRHLWDEAAAAAGMTLSEFIVSTAVISAQEIIAGHRVLVLDEAGSERFLAALGRPAREIPRLRELLSGVGPASPLSDFRG
jgi:uncharacterized protein (DUF1778 family)